MNNKPIEEFTINDCKTRIEHLHGKMSLMADVVQKIENSDYKIKISELTLFFIEQSEKINKELKQIDKRIDELLMY